MAYYEDGNYIYVTDETSFSATSTSTSNSSIARNYATMVSDRMQKDNLAQIDKNHIADLIYNVLMQDDIPIKKQELFKDEEFEI